MSPPNFDHVSDLKVLDPYAMSRQLPYSDLYKMTPSEISRFQPASASKIPNGQSRIAVKFARAPQDLLANITANIKRMVDDQVILQDAHISPIFSSTTIQGHPALLLPLYKNGNVMVYISRNPHADKHQLVLDIAHGLAYLHRMRMLHRNICTNNVLIDDNGRACLTDIGFYHVMRASTGRDHTVPQTWQYKPGEELHPQSNGPLQPTPAMDVYAFGSVAYEIFCGGPPYSDTYRDFAAIVEHGHAVLPQPQAINDPMWRIILQCWARNPSARPTMSQVVGALEQFIRRDYT